MYLPYGYSEDIQYDVFYFMHGGWSNETSTLGTPGNENEFKNVLDNAIQNGEIEPLIVVCPTYNNTNYNNAVSEKEFYLVEDAGHFDLYDLDPYVTEAVEQIVSFFGMVLN